MTDLRALVETFMRDLQNKVIAQFEAEEPDGNPESYKFTRTPWTKPEGGQLQGGGTMALMRGKVFEKVGVNVSCVYGTFSEQFRKEIPGAIESEGAFWACGVSLVAHPASPLVPAVHLNVRRIETSKGWFGGGADMTPAIPFEEDTKHFHSVFGTICESYRKGAHAEYRKWCDEYFYLPHRHEPRGIGGIFFDYLATDDAEADWSFVQKVGNSLTEAYFPLVQKRKHLPFTAEDKQAQRIKRGRYAEFNLLYDRGTRFGLQTGGNTEAILMSLPPEASW